jgi:hypothetical protein
MTGFIPEPPQKSVLDYLSKSQYNAIRIPLGIFKIILGIFTFVIVPLSIFIYLILMVFARRFMFSDIPELCLHVIEYSVRLIKTGYFDIFYRLDKDGED